MDNLEDMDKFLEIHKLPRLNHDERENLNRLMMSKEIESVVKNLPANKITGPDGFTGKLTEELIPILLSSSKNRRGNFSLIL